MKFEKFVKSLASSGVIYERGVTGAEFVAERWLASPSVFMLIPDGTRSVTAVGIQDMPPAIDKMIDQVGHTDTATLVKAVMPYPDSAIKDCVRVFATPDGQVKLPICNDDWTLIEKSDVCEILFTYDVDTNAYEGKALLVKQYPTCPGDDDLELVGIIFPLNLEN